jgi:predicted component of type VI protein secretion system
MAEREVLFEFTQLGTTVRVAAIDAASGVEVVVMAPARTARGDLERLALAKLDRRLAKDNPSG